MKKDRLLANSTPNPMLAPEDVIHTLQMHNDDLAEENKAIKERVKILEKENVQLATNIKELVAQNQELLTKLKEAETNMKFLNTRVVELRAKIEAYQDCIKNLR